MFLEVAVSHTSIFRLINTGSQQILEINFYIVYLILQDYVCAARVVSIRRRRYSRSCTAHRPHRYTNSPLAKHHHSTLIKTIARCMRQPRNNSIVAHTPPHRSPAKPPPGPICRQPMATSRGAVSLRLCYAHAMDHDHDLQTVFELYKRCLTTNHAHRLAADMNTPSFVLFVLDKDIDNEIYGVLTMFFLC
jgi:hypothetical protein